MDEALTFALHSHSGWTPNPVMLHSQILDDLLAQSRLLTEISAQALALQHSLGNVFEGLRALDSARCEGGAPLVPCKRGLQQYFGTAAPCAFALQLRGTLANPVCRGKYFTFSVSLLDLHGSLPRNLQLPVVLSLYSAESPPRRITTNMSGQAVLKGPHKALLSYTPLDASYTASFKVQLNEVTSHFRNGWVFLLVSVENHEFWESTGEIVKPLLLEHLVSKAKETTCSRWRAAGKVTDILPEPS